MIVDTEPGSWHIYHHIRSFIADKEVNRRLLRYACEETQLRNDLEGRTAVRMLNSASPDQVVRYRVRSDVLRDADIDEPKAGMEPIPIVCERCDDGVTQWIESLSQ